MKDYLTSNRVKSIQLICCSLALLSISALAGCSKPKVKPAPIQTSTSIPGALNKDRVVQEMNRHRRSPLTRHAQLDAAAQGHADWMAANEKLSHQGASGSSAADRVTAAGYRWQGVAENIAAGQRTETEVVDAWFKSPGHRKNMQCNYRHTGVGVAQGPGGILYWATVFGTPR